VLQLLVVKGRSVRAAPVDAARSAVANGSYFVAREMTAEGENCAFLRCLC
jgi:hypothetical protein